MTFAVDGYHGHGFAVFNDIAGFDDPGRRGEDVATHPEMAVKKDFAGHHFFRHRRWLPP